MACRRQQPAAALPRARISARGRALSAAAALSVLLLCALPLLCIAHCRLSGGHHGAHAGHHSAASHGGHGSVPVSDPASALCDHMGGAGDGMFIPAFWPGLPAAGAVLLAGLALLLRLAASAPALLLTPPGAPLPPPPR